MLEPPPRVAPPVVPPVAGDEARLERAKDLFRRSIETKQAMIDAHVPGLLAMADVCLAALAAGGKILMCGNGGSAADAQHLAAELLVRLRPTVTRDGIPALALALDPSSMTACCNDFSFDLFYDRMVRTLGAPGDVLLAITTSGKSPNILAAMGAARDKGLHVLAFLGSGGGPALALADLALVVPSAETGRIQEAHITAGHALMELIEDGVLARRSGGGSP